jgi:hypothetical protein
MGFTDVNMFDEAPEVFLDEAHGPSEYDGKVGIALVYPGVEDIWMTLEAAGNLSEAIRYTIGIEEDEIEDHRRLRGVMFMMFVAVYIPISIAIYGGLIYGVFWAMSKI